MCNGDINKEWILRLSIVYEDDCFNFWLKGHFSVLINVNGSITNSVCKIP